MSCALQSSFDAFCNVNVHESERNFESESKLETICGTENVIRKFFYYCGAIKGLLGFRRNPFSLHHGRVRPEAVDVSLLDSTPAEPELTLWRPPSKMLIVDGVTGPFDPLLRLPLPQFDGQAAALLQHDKTLSLIGHSTFHHFQTRSPKLMLW